MKLSVSKISKKKRYAIVCIVLLLAVAGSTFIFLNNSWRHSPYGTVSLENLETTACQRITDAEKCFTLNGTLYAVSVHDTQKVVNALKNVISQNKLYSNSEFTNERIDTIDSATLATSEGALGDAFRNEPRTIGAWISIQFRGGLFGVNSFPFNEETNDALYVSSFFLDKSHSSSASDINYIVRSEFNVSEEVARNIIEKAEALPSDQYLLMVAKAKNR